MWYKLEKYWHRYERENGVDILRKTQIAPNLWEVVTKKAGEWLCNPTTSIIRVAI